MPSRCAAAAPSTTTGSRSVAALRKLPCQTLVPTARGRPRLAALIEIALVSIDGISGDRKTLPLTAPVYWTCVTGPIRAIIAGATSGSSAV